MLQLDGAQAGQPLIEVMPRAAERLSQGLRLGTQSIAVRRRKLREQLR